MEYCLFPNRGIFQEKLHVCNFAWWIEHRAGEAELSCGLSSLKGFHFAAHIPSASGSQTGARLSVQPQDSSSSYLLCDTGHVSVVLCRPIHKMG